MESTNNLIDSSMHTVHEWYHLPAGYVPKGICEAYLKGTLDLHLHLSRSEFDSAPLASGDNHLLPWFIPSQSCAVFHAPRIVNSDVLDDAIESQAGQVELRLSNDRKEAVLVGVVHFMEEPERVSARIPSVIWLRPLDHCLLAMRQVSDEPPTVSGEAGGVIVDRKSGSVVRGAGSFQGQLPDQVVQSGAEGVSEVTNEKPVEYRWRLRNGGGHETISGVTVLVYSDAIRVVFSEPLRSAHKLVQVLTCSKESGDDHSRWGNLNHELHLLHERQTSNDSEGTQGRGDPRAHAGRSNARPEEGGHTNRPFTHSPQEEVTPVAKEVSPFIPARRACGRGC